MFKNFLQYVGSNTNRDTASCFALLLVIAELFLVQTIKPAGLLFVAAVIFAVPFTFLVMVGICRLCDSINPTKEAS